MGHLCVGNMGVYIVVYWFMYLWDMGVYVVVNLCLKVHGKLSSDKALKKSALVNVRKTFPFSIIHIQGSPFI